MTLFSDSAVNALNLYGKNNIVNVHRAIVPAVNAINLKGKNSHSEAD